jgi:hypothetical protein
MKSRWVKRILGAATAGGILFAGLLIASPAQATPTGCTAVPVASGNYSYAYCLGGTGQVQALATCYKPNTGQTIVKQGQWVHAGVLSYAYCPAGYELIGASFATK